MQHGRNHQRQQRRPEQRQIGIVVGAARQYRHKFRVGAPLGAGDGLGNLALLVLIENGHAIGL
ncbi:hypothetical protein D3C80_2191670 [compost metagenome]